MSWPVGIDFGTSNSTVGSVDGNTPMLVAVENERRSIPTAMFFDFETRHFSFGRAAIDAYTSAPREGRLLRALKSVLGSSLIEEHTQFGNQRLPFTAVVTKFLRHLKATSEARLGDAVDSAVLGRPVSFVDDDPAADRRAQDQLHACARAAGFRDVRFQYEPIAAAFEHELSVATEELVLVADLGGGTADFSIARVAPDRRGRPDRSGDILASAGVHVGGTNFDYRLSMRSVMPLFGHGTLTTRGIEMPSHFFQEMATWHRIPYLYDRKNASGISELPFIAARRDLLERFITVVRKRYAYRLAGDVEDAKIALSTASSAGIDLDYVEHGLTASPTVADFDAATSELRAAITRTLQSCLLQAGVGPAGIDTVFFTGGTSLIPSVRDACMQVVPGARPVEGDPEGSVGKGLAIEARRCFGAH